MYSENVGWIIRYIELCNGLGLGAGPFLGSAVYDWLDYEVTMYLFAVINAIALAVCWWALPSSLNQDPEKRAATTVSQKEVLSRVSWKNVLCNRHLIFALLTMFLVTYLLNMYAGFISTNLIRLGFAGSNTGYIYGGQSVFYLLTCGVYGVVFDHWPRKFQLLYAQIGFAACCVLIGPSAFLDLPEDYWLIIIGVVYLGIF